MLTNDVVSFEQPGPGIYCQQSYDITFVAVLKVAAQKTNATDDGIF